MDRIIHVRVLDKEVPFKTVRNSLAKKRWFTREIKDAIQEGDMKQQDTEKEISTGKTIGGNGMKSSGLSRRRKWTTITTKLTRIRMTMRRCGRRWKN